jgi:hypothetical protein
MNRNFNIFPSKTETIRVSEKIRGYVSEDSERDVLTG